MTKYHNNQIKCDSRIAGPIHISRPKRPNEQGGPKYDQPNGPFNPERLRNAISKDVVTVGNQPLLVNKGDLTMLDYTYAVSSEKVDTVTVYSYHINSNHNTLLYTAGTGDTFNTRSNLTKVIEQMHLADGKKPRYIEDECQNITGIDKSRFRHFLESRKNYDTVSSFYTLKANDQFDIYFLKSGVHSSSRDNLILQFLELPDPYPEPPSDQHSKPKLDGFLLDMNRIKNIMHYFEDHVTDIYIHLLAILHALRGTLRYEDKDKEIVQALERLLIFNNINIDQFFNAIENTSHEYKSYPTGYAHKLRQELDKLLNKYPLVSKVETWVAAQRDSVQKGVELDMSLMPSEQEFEMSENNAYQRNTNLKLKERRDLVKFVLRGVPLSTNLYDEWTIMLLLHLYKLKLKESNNPLLSDNHDIIYNETYQLIMDEIDSVGVVNSVDIEFEVDGNKINVELVNCMCSNINTAKIVLTINRLAAQANVPSKSSNKYIESKKVLDELIKKIHNEVKPWIAKTKPVENTIILLTVLLNEMLEELDELYCELELLNKDDDNYSTIESKYEDLNTLYELLEADIEKEKAILKKLLDEGDLVNKNVLFVELQLKLDELDAISITVAPPAVSAQPSIQVKEKPKSGGKAGGKPGGKAGGKPGKRNRFIIRSESSDDEEDTDNNSAEKQILDTHFEITLPFLLNHLKLLDIVQDLFGETCSDNHLYQIYAAITKNIYQDYIINNVIPKYVTLTQNQTIYGRFSKYDPAKRLSTMRDDADTVTDKYGSLLKAIESLKNITLSQDTADIDEIKEELDLLSKAVSKRHTTKINLYSEMITSLVQTMFARDTEKIGEIIQTFHKALVQIMPRRDTNKIEESRKELETLNKVMLDQDNTKIDKAKEVIEDLVLAILREDTSEVNKAKEAFEELTKLILEQDIGNIELARDILYEALIKYSNIIKHHDADESKCLNTLTNYIITHDKVRNGISLSANGSLKLLASGTYYIEIPLSNNINGTRPLKFVHQILSIVKTSKLLKLMKDTSNDIKSNCDPRQITDGLYSYQVKLIENVANRLFNYGEDILNKPNIFVVTVYLGGGKTTVVLGLSSMVTRLNDSQFKFASSLSSNTATLDNPMGGRKTIMIYCSTNKEELEKATARLNKNMSTGVGNSIPYHAYTKHNAKHGRDDTISYAKYERLNHGYNISLNKLGDIFKAGGTIVCHTRTAVRLLAEIDDYDNKMAASNNCYHRTAVVLIMDEIQPGSMNSLDNHSIGVLFAYERIGPYCFIPMSASIIPNSQISLYMNDFTHKSYVLDNEIVLPAALRQTNGDLMDLLAEAKIDSALRVIEVNDNFKRMISSAAIQELYDHSTVNGKQQIMLMVSLGVTSPSAIYLNYNDHENARIIPWRANKYSSDSVIGCALYKYYLRSKAMTTKNIISSYYTSITGLFKETSEYSSLDLPKNYIRLMLLISPVYQYYKTRMINKLKLVSYEYAGQRYLLTEEIIKFILKLSKLTNALAESSKMFFGHDKETIRFNLIIGANHIFDKKYANGLSSNTNIIEYNRLSATIAGLFTTNNQEQPAKATTAILNRNESKFFNINVVMQQYVLDRICLMHKKIDSMRTLNGGNNIATIEDIMNDPVTGDLVKDLFSEVFNDCTTSNSGHDLLIEHFKNISNICIKYIIKQLERACTICNNTMDLLEKISSYNEYYNTNNIESFVTYYYNLQPKKEAREKYNIKYMSHKNIHQMVNKALLEPDENKYEQVIDDIGCIKRVDDFAICFTNDHYLYLDEIYMLPSFMIYEEIMLHSAFLRKLKVDKGVKLSDAVDEKLLNIFDEIVGDDQHDSGTYQYTNDDGVIIKLSDNYALELQPKKVGTKTMTVGIMLYFNERNKPNKLKINSELPVTWTLFAKRLVEISDMQNDERNEFIEKRSWFIRQIGRTADSYIANAGIKHVVNTTIELDDISNLYEMSNGTMSISTVLENVYNIIGIRIFHTKDDVNYYLSIYANRVFAGEDCARAINMRFESAIITQDFETATNESIIQATGRCGRPGLAKKSTVYMSFNKYRNLLTTHQIDSITEVILRYRFYKQSVQRVSDIFEERYEKVNYKDQIVYSVMSNITNYQP